MDKPVVRADYQHDLSVSYERMGDLYSALRLANLLTAAGKATESKPYFERDLEIARKLADSEHALADLQIDLAISLAGSEDWAEDPRPMVAEAVQILERLDAEGRLPVNRRPLLVAVRDQLT